MHLHLERANALQPYAAKYTLLHLTVAINNMTNENIAAIAKQNRANMQKNMTRPTSHLIEAASETSQQPPQ